LILSSVVFNFLVLKSRKHQQLGQGQGTWGVVATPSAGRFLTGGVPSIIEARLDGVRMAPNQRKRKAHFAGPANPWPSRSCGEALTSEHNCSDVLRLIAAARGAMNGLMAELLEDHVRFNALDPKRKPTSEQAMAADALIDVVKAYLKQAIAGSPRDMGFWHQGRCNRLFILDIFN
jgi:DNA-binding FrmR family transcriptional regulator